MVSNSAQQECAHPCIIPLSVEESSRTLCTQGAAIARSVRFTGWPIPTASTSCCTSCPLLYVSTGAFTAQAGSLGRGEERARSMNVLRWWLR